MNLSVLEWSDAIAHYNEEFGTEIALNESFGLKSLCEDQLHALSSALENLKDAQLNNLGETYEEISKNIDSDHKKYNKERDQWYEKILVLFDSGDYWKGLLADTAENKKARKEVKKVKSLWQLQKDFSTLSSDAIFKMAKFDLPIVLNYFVCAQRELRRKKSALPKQLLNQFKNYVSSTGDAVRELQKVIVDIMLVRLKVAAESYNWTVDDVAMYVAKRIDKRGLLGPEHKRVFPPKSGFDEKNISFFIDYILNHGDSDQRLSLSHLEWFKTNKDYKKIQRGREVFLVPGEFKDHVPRFYFSRKLFAQRYFRHHFFEEKKWLICRLKTLHTHTKVPKRVTVAMAEKLISDLCDLESQVLSANQEAQSQKVTNWRRVFHKRMNMFADASSRYTYAQSQRLAEKKLEVVHVMRIKMQMDLEGVDQVGQYVSQSLIERINDLCQSLDKNHLGQMCSEESLHRYDGDTSYFNTLLVAYEKTNLRVTETEESEVLSFSIEEESDEGFETTMEENVAVETVKARGVFEATSNVELSSLSDSNFEQVINALNAAIKELPDEADDDYLKAAMMKHFLAYLACCHGVSSKEEFESKRERIERIEELLLDHGPDFVKKRVGELVSQRDGEESSWFGFKMLCEIFLQSCGDSESSSLSLTRSGV